MDSIALLDDKLVSGTVSGDVSLEGLHQDAHADAQLSIDALSVGSVAYKSAKVQLKADGHLVDASVRIDQPDGFVEAKAHASESWGAATAPSLDPSQPLDANLSAKNFRIAALLPFVDGVLDELDGRLDADTRIELDPRGKGGAAERDAGAEPRNRRGIGRGRRAARHRGEREVRAGRHGHTREAHGGGSDREARRHGDRARSRERALQSAHAVVTIPSKSAIPFTAGGTEVGNFDGRIDLSASTAQGGRTLQVKVEVPKLNVALPEGATGNPQALGPMDKVRIGALRGDPRAVRARCPSTR